MATIECCIKNPKGVHCRVATRLAEIVQQHDADVRIAGSSGEADCQSVLDVLSLGLVRNSRVRCTATGKDAETVLLSLHTLLIQTEDP